MYYYVYLQFLFVISVVRKELKVDLLGWGLGKLIHNLELSAVPAYTTEYTL